jgi:hypothetical protein
MRAATLRRPAMKMPRAPAARGAEDVGGAGARLGLGGGRPPVAAGTHVAGGMIRGELKAAADDLQEARAKPDSASLRRLRGDFPHHAVTVDARAWPEVAVTLHGLPRDTCRAVASTARRIEGLVVVALQRYRSADECGASNNMTWRFMP